MKNQVSQSAGFSLVETLVAITILLIVIVGAMSISAKAAKSTSFSNEQVVAFFLAQEGVEIIQKTRDEFLLQNFATNPQTGWTNFLNSYASCYAANGCGVELYTNTTGGLKTPVSCTGTNCALYYKSSGGRSRYTHTAAGATPTVYTRVIKLVPTGNREVKVTSTVTWRTGSIRATQQAKVESYLFNVYGN